MIALVAASILVAAAVYGLIKVFLIRHAIDKLPGPPTKWLINLHQMGPDKVEESLEFDIQYKGLFRFYVAPWIPVVWISDSKYIKTFLKSNSPKAEDAYFSLKPWLGDGLLLANGNRWSRSRRLLTPAFHFDILKPYMDVYNEAANTIVDIWSAKAVDGEYFDVMPSVSLLTLDVILRCAMSTETDCQTDTGGNPYIDAVTQVAFLTMDRIASVSHRFDVIYNLTSHGRQFKKALHVLHSQSEQIIQSRRAELEESKGDTSHGKYRDFLDILLTARDEDGRGLTDKEIRDEVDTFMFEGHDTTAHGIGWTLYCLGLHPEFQALCREEIDNLLVDGDRDFTWADMDKLEYVHMCIREAMRLFPPVPVIGRQQQTDLDLDGKTIPGGSLVVMSLLGLHRNPNLFDNPKEYRPSRFSAEEMKKRDPFSYAPFSAGPRNCIGQVFASHEEKITVAKILRKYVVETDADHELVLRYALVLRSNTGIRIRLRERGH